MSSLDLMRAIWPRDDLDAKEKATLLALLQHVDDRLRCWPSIARLATYTSLKRRALQYALASLEHRGFIQVHRGAGQGGASVYVVQPASWRGGVIMQSFRQSRSQVTADLARAVAAGRKDQ